MAKSEFLQEVERHFGFLESLGFRREASDSGRESSVAFVKPSVAVLINQETGSPPYVTLEDRSLQENPPWWFRRRFGVHELSQETGSPGSPLPDTLASQADILNRYGAAVLSGDFGILHARQRRLGLAVKSNHE